jgi:FKBP-type peptidyl-prolyl cis-trans isomerase
MKKNKNQQLMEQREQSQVRLRSAESRQKKAKGQYIQANRDWLVAKSQEDGVKALPGGVYYKVLAEGDATSATPTPSSVITAHYTGWTIDGKQFDSSRGDVPLACRLRDLIEGWIIAMQQMHIGDRWEVYIPAEMGYGKFSQPGIPSGSTLIFDIELLAIN